MNPKYRKNHRKGHLTERGETVLTGLAFAFFIVVWIFCSSIQ